MSRINRLSLILLAGFLLLAANLVRMQVFQGDYYRLRSEKNRIRVIYLEGPRGKILDRKREVLASSRLSFNCSVIPREAKRHIHESCEFVGNILGMEPEELEKRFRRKKPGAYQTVLEKFVKKY